MTVVRSRIKLCRRICENRSAMQSTLKILFCVLALFPIIGRADLVTNINPLADSYIQQFSTDINSGGETSMMAGALGDPDLGEISRSLVRFDLTGKIPSGAIINSATLQLAVVMVPL